MGRRVSALAVCHFLFPRGGMNGYDWLRHQTGNQPMKCVLCHERKGKRNCKLTSAEFICPPCCASTRRDECSGCAYYEPSLAYQSEKQIRNKAFIAEIRPDLDDRCDEALTLVDEGDMAKGESILRDLQTRHPNYHSVLYGIGVCHCLKVEAAEAIRHGLETLDADVPLDFLCIDLRGAIEALGLITGETVTADIIDRIFADFCVGK